MLKSKSGIAVVSNRWESFVSLFRGFALSDLNSKILKRDFQLPTIMSVQSNISFSSCLYWYATLNSCKYLKSETHLRDAQANKASSVNKGIVKICLVVDMVRKNWSRIVAAGFGLHYFVQFVLVHFVSLQILVQPKDLNICFSRL